MRKGPRGLQIPSIPWAVGLGLELSSSCPKPPGFPGGTLVSPGRVKLQARRITRKLRVELTLWAAPVSHGRSLGWAGGGTGSHLLEI